MFDSFYNSFIAEDRYRMILDGLQVTLLITAGAVILGTLLGGLICRMRMSRHKGLQKVAKVCIDIVRGTPEQIFEHPVHSATKAFIQRIRKEVFEIDALDFMVEKMETTPLSGQQRSQLAKQCQQVVEEPTERGFRVKLII